MKIKYLVLFPINIFASINLVQNPYLKTENGVLVGYSTNGDVQEVKLGSLMNENNSNGILLSSAKDLNRDKELSGRVTTLLKSGVPNTSGSWLRFSITALAQENFEVKNDNLILKAEFFGNDGKLPLDHVQTSFARIIKRERKDLKDSGTNQSLGHSTWRHYSLLFRIPFNEVDTIRLSVQFSEGIGKGRESNLIIREFEVRQIPSPEENSRQLEAKLIKSKLTEMVHLGGRWYYDPKNGDEALPQNFNHENADSLIYLSDRPIAPFANNMTSWLRAGWLDRDGNIAHKDTFVQDNLTIRVSKQHLILYSKNLPNHPTAIFPDKKGSIDGNPNRIQEKRHVWHLPLEPKPNINRKAMDSRNSNQALPRGAIGIAVNGVIFFNPFDHINETDAIWRMDRCCGHPSPSRSYHYHKYPVCIKTPWIDNGEQHSPVIGFAFDGYPVYGPYESKNILAKAAESNPLNDFNVHFDKIRDWHYHVTPGRFPHIIGGYWGINSDINKRTKPSRKAGYYREQKRPNRNY